MNKEIDNYLENQEILFHRTVYKSITQYSMIAVEKAIKANQKIKDAIENEFDAKIEKELLKPISSQKFAFDSYYQRRLKAVKTNWKDLEGALVNVVANRIVKRQKEESYKKLMKKFPDCKINYEDYDMSLFSNDELKGMVQRNLTWLKRHYNSMRMIKSFKKRYNNNYYWNVTKIKKKIGSRADANVKRGENRSVKTKEMVLAQALLLRDKNVKITIDSVHNQINDNGLKLGKTQIAKYLKTLRAEGQL